MQQLPVQPALANSWSEGLVNFAFRVYDQKEMESLCLKLQNDYHANVNLILWCCWLEKQQVGLSAEWLDDVLITVDTLSQLTLSRLREVRRVVNEAAGFTRVQAKLINKHIVNAELTAEKIFLQRLQDLTSRFLEAEQPSAVTLNEFPDLTLYYYLEFLKVPKASRHSEKLLGLCD